MLVIVGGGIGGGALSKCLADAGLVVLVLERTARICGRRHEASGSRRGESRRRSGGAYDLYRANGGHHLTRHVSYDEDIDPAVAESAAFDMTTLLPDNPGPLCIGHPAMCNLLNRRRRRRRDGAAGCREHAS